MDRVELEKQIKKELGLPEWVKLMPFIEEILEQAMAWQSMSHIIPEETKKLPYLIQANKLVREIESYRKK